VFILKMPFWFAPKRAQGDVSHCILITHNMKSSERAASLQIDTQSQDTDELFGN
jgi:hypothetical protein